MTAEAFLDGKVTLRPGDCLEVMRELDADSFDAIVTDPPYGLEFMGKGWDGADGFRRSLNKADAGRDSVFGRSSRKAPEYKAGSLFQEFMHAVAGEALRVLKPGGYLVAFGGTRTYHRMTCAIEDAGFEIRDCIMWLYGSGFPKSLDVSKAIDKAAGAEREVIATGKPVKRMIPGADQHKGGWEKNNGRVYVPGETAPATEAAAQWDGWGTALKPACEPIVLARKPLIGTVAANVQRWGTGALNIDGCRIENSEYDPSKVQRQSSNRQTWEGGAASGFFADHEQQTYNAKGRHPANIVHDGSDEVVGAFPSTASHGDNGGARSAVHGVTYGEPVGGQERVTRKDSGSAARFFYTAKADADDRLGSKHPTVKPLDLKQWLVRLVTPKGGLVLDPFAGTGTTGEAAWREGMRCMLIQRGASEDELGYLDDIRRRMKHALSGPDERKRVIAKTKAKDDGLFGLFDSVPVVASASPSNASANGMTE